MQLELNGRTYLFAILIGLGLLFEALKLFSVPELRHDVSLLPYRPYAISEKSIHQVAKALEAPGNARAVRAAPSVPAFDFKGALDKWQKEQAKAKEDEKRKAALKNWHWVWNKNLGKWEWKKKKKKKKETDSKKTDAAQTMIDDGTQAPAPAPSDQTAPIGGQLGPRTNPATAIGLAPGLSDGSAPHTFLTMQQWENLLLGSANQANTQNFINQYKQHLISEPMFYQIVNAMLTSGSQAIQLQGVYALGMTPSVQSFTMLVSESQTGQTSSPVAQSANSYLAQYSQTQNLPILQQILAGTQPTPQVLTDALNELQTAIQTSLGPTSNPTIQNANASAFSSFLPILATLSSNQNQTIATEASTLLHQLQGASGKSPTA